MCGIAETGQKIGFITPLTHNFCESCNRVRLTCTGELFMCLGQEDRADLRAPLRAGAGDAASVRPRSAPPSRASPRAMISTMAPGGWRPCRSAGQMSRHMSHTGG
jgi:cyclic pyranopterin phosphate synthase